MKKLEIIIRPEKLESLKDTINKCGIKGMMITSIMGCGNQKGVTQVYRGTELSINLLPKIKVEVVVSSDVVDKLIEEIVKTVKTGAIGDGKIFVYEVYDVIRIRTGETGNEAI